MATQFAAPARVQPLAVVGTPYRAVIVGVCVPPVGQLGANHVAECRHLVMKNQGAARPNEGVQVAVGVYRADHVKIRDH